MAKQLEFTLKILGTDSQVKSIEAIRASLLQLNTQLQSVSASSVSFDVITVKIDQLNARLSALESSASASVNAISVASTRQKSNTDGLVSSISSVGKAFEESLGSIRTVFSEIEGETISLEQGFKKGMEVLDAASSASALATKVSILETVVARKLEEAQIYLSAAAESKNTVVRYAAITANRLLAASNPYTAMAAVIFGVVGALAAYNALAERTTAIERERKALAEATTDLNKSTAQSMAPQLAQMERFRLLLTDTTSSIQKRRNALAEYNQVADKNNQLSERDLDNLEKINAAIDNNTKLLEKKARFTAAQEMYTDALKESFKAQYDLNAATEQAASSSVGILGALRKETYDTYESFKALFSGDAAMAGAIKVLGADVLKQYEHSAEAANKLKAAHILFTEAVKESGAADVKSLRQNVAVQLQVSNEANNVLSELSRKLVDAKIAVIKDGRKRELKEEEQTLNDKQEALRLALDKIYKVRNDIERGRKEILSSGPLNSNAKAELQRLNLEYAKVQEQIRQGETIATEVRAVLVEEGRQKIEQINTKYDGIDLELYNKALSQRLESIEKSAEMEILLLDTASVSKRNALKKESDKGIITTEQASQKMLEVESEFQLQKNNITIKATQQRLDILLLEQQALVALQASKSKLSDQEEKKLKDLQAMIAAVKNQLANLNAESLKITQAPVPEQNPFTKLKGDIDKAIAAIEKYESYARSVLDPLFGMFENIGRIEEMYFERSIALQEEKIIALETKLQGTSGRQRAIYEAQLKEERAQLEKTEAAKEQTRLKYAKIRRAKDILDATVTTVKSSLGAFSSLIGIPVVGPVLAPLAAIAAGAFGASQIALIASTPLALGGDLSGDISNVHNGSIPAGAGEIAGPSHSHPSGGVHFTYGGRPFVAEGGELKTNNGDRRYIFTKGVGRDPVLRRLALATHNSSGSPVAHMVAGIVNAAAGGRQFAHPIAGAMLAAGGDLSAYAQPLLPQPLHIATATDPRIIALLEETKATQAELRANLSELQRRHDNLQIVLPVDTLTDFQQNEKFVKESAIF